MGDDDRRKKSWREIDRQKDKSRHRGRDDKASRQRGASSKYRRDLDKLFESGGEVPERFKEVTGELEPEEGTPEAERRDAIRALRDAEGFRAFAEAVKEYREEGWALPDDEQLLARMLDHPDMRVVRDVLEHIVDLDKRRSINRPGPIKNRLSTIETMTDDPQTLELVERVKAIVA